MTDITACLGVCNAAHRDVNRRYEAALAKWEQEYRKWLQGSQDADAPDRPEEPELDPPVPGEPIYCARCKATYRRKLSELDELSALVQSHIDGHRSVPLDTERVSGTPGHASPEPRVDAVDALLAWAEFWEDAYRDFEKMDARPPRGRYVNRVTGCLSWLAVRSDAILANGDVAQRFAHQISSQHKTLMAIAHADHGERILPKPCPSCDLKAMTVRSGDEHAKCANCGLVRASADYEVDK